MRIAILAFVAAAAGASFLAACETMSTEECAAADWGALGYADGANGTNRFAARQESCARRGFTADLQAYVSGNDQGLRAYCTPQRGFQRGLQGSSYDGFCPGDLDVLFSQAHADGYRAYQARSALDAAQGEVNRLQNRRDEIDRAIRDSEAALAAATTDDERGRLRNQIGALNDERRRVNDDIRTQQQAVRIRGEALDRVRYDIGDRWGPW